MENLKRCHRNTSSFVGEGGNMAVEKRNCDSCDLPKTINKDFYLSNNDFHKKDNRFPVCKLCVKDAIDYENTESVYDILMQMNRPFLHELWNKSILEREKTGKDLFGLYYKNLILNHKTLTWKQSIFETEKEISKKDLISPSDSQAFAFKVTNEMVMRWGSSDYQAEDYMKLEDFYQSMKKSNRIETPQEETYLKKLAVISLKMDKELDAGNYSQVKQLGDLFSKYMADSKFRAMDKTEADKTGGIRNFSTIFAEVEKDDHIPPWEYYKKIKNISQDIVDKTIMHIENFTLRLNKIERMVHPPDNTPVIEEDEYDRVDDE